MKKQTTPKRIIALALAVLLIFTMLPLAAATPSDLPTTETQTTSPAALAPTYIGITPLNITINVADLITAGVNAGSVAFLCRKQFD